MRHLFFAVLILCVTAVLSYASSYNFKCLSRNGWSPGYGRYSYQGEWVDYFGVRAKAGEYVLFYYPKGGHGYWFPRSKCYEL